MPPTQRGDRSRGGFTTKIHAQTDAEGLPVALILSPCEARDCTVFDALMAERDRNPKVTPSDKGYDTNDIQAVLLARAAAPEIPTIRRRSNTACTADDIRNRNTTCGSTRRKSSVTSSS